MNKADLAHRIELARRNGESIRATYQCGHALDDINLDLHFQYRIVDADALRETGVKATTGFEFTSEDGKLRNLAMIDNHSLCPECWKKASALPESSHADECETVFFRIH